jgi:hypothetical protein
MIYKTLEVSLSKEERRIVDEHGNAASTWARIGFTVEIEPGDIPDMCIKQLKSEIQPEVDEWLLNQDGYIIPPGETIEEAEERMSVEFFQNVPVKITEVADNVGDDEIPL